MYIKQFTTMYMHTLDGQPASFDGRDYIHFADGRHPAMLVSTLRRLRWEQKLASPGAGRFTFGYVRVEIPTRDCATCGQVKVRDRV